LRAKQLLVEFYDSEDDEHFKREMSDTRRPKLTMKHIQKLRKYKDRKNMEKAEHLKFVQTMYATPDPEEEGLGGVGGDEFSV